MARLSGKISNLEVVLSLDSSFAQIIAVQPPTFFSHSSIRLKAPFVPKLDVGVCKLTNIFLYVLAG